MHTRRFPEFFSALALLASATTALTADAPRDTIWDTLPDTWVATCQFEKLGRTVTFEGSMNTTDTQPVTICGRDATLRHIAEGAIPTAPLITGTVGIDGVADAFVALGSPERHAKILVRP